MTIKPETTASQCRHYAMCKIDFLDTGLCPAGREKGFTSFYPQGRMDIYAALERKALSLSPALIEIAESCIRCGVCDKQCYFVNELRPRPVAVALQEKVRAMGRQKPPSPRKPHPLLKELQEIVGQRWATDDPAHRICYAHDPCPITDETLPDFVVLPADTGEVQGVVAWCHRHGIPFKVRGNGSSVMGFVLTPGLVIDTIRIRELDFDEKNWMVRVGAGITSFELQKAAAARGYRVNTAEPAASYCGNIMCSGIFSLFSASYGTGADNFVDAEFVDPTGNIFRLSDPKAPNLFAFRKADVPLPGICTRAAVRLHPTFPDEGALAVPFDSLPEALNFTRELGQRRIGTGIGLLGTEYLSTFIAPTAELAQKGRELFTRDLGISHMVLVLGDRYALDCVRRMTPRVMEAPLMRTLILALPTLCRGDWQSLLSNLDSGDPPYALLFSEEFQTIIDTLLQPAAENLAEAVDPDLKDFYSRLYSRPEMTDILWLNTFRIISSRMGREGHVVAFILYVPLEEPSLIRMIDQRFRKVIRDHGVRGDFGFLTPLDRGRRGVLEWDFYLDHTDPREVQAMQQAMAAAAAMIEALSAEDSRILWIRYLLNQGTARKESFLYPDAALK